MNDPLTTTATVNTWVKIATNITSGVIIKSSVGPGQYLCTYRLTGEAAPTDLIGAVPLNDALSSISSAAAIDVYIYCTMAGGSVTFYNIAFASTGNVLLQSVVPAADSAVNNYSSDVIGNKNDTVAGTSIVALDKQLLAAILVPAQNAVTNLNLRDVIGNKTDTTAGTSLISLIKIASITNISKVYPTLAAGIVVTGAAGAWTLGAFAVVVATSAIATNFTIYNVTLEDTGSAGVFELVLYSGPDASEVEICRTRICRSTTYGYGATISIRTPVIAANSQIKAKLASLAGGAQTLTISLSYSFAS